MKSLKISYEQIFWTLLLLFLVLIAGFRVIGLDADYFNYIKFFTPQSKLELITKEFGFRFFLLFNAWAFDSNVDTFFLLFACLGISIKINAFTSHSPIPLLSFAIYLLSYFLLHDYTQIRAGVASGIFLLSIPNLSKGEKGPYFKKVILACLFHWTALIMMPLYFFIRKFSFGFFSILPFIGILLFLLNFNFDQYILKFIGNFPALSIYYLAHSGHDAAINIFNIINLAFLGLFVIILILFHFMESKFSQFEIDMLKIFSTSIFSFYLFAILNRPVIAFRVFEFLNISLLLFIPYLVIKFKQWYLASIGFLLFFSLYLLHLLVNVKVIP